MARSDSKSRPGITGVEIDKPRREPNKRHESAYDSRFLTFACYRRLPLLGSAWARDTVVEHLAHTRSRLGFQLFAYVVMPDHVHLLLHPNIEVATVRRILSALKTRTASIVLERIRREDPTLAARARDARGFERLWQPGGGYDRNVCSQREFLEKARYIEENPVRRGLVALPEDYAWSSAGSLLLGRDPW